MTARTGLATPGVFTLGGSIAVKGFHLHFAYQDPPWSRQSWTYFENRWKWSWGYQKVF